MNRLGRAELVAAVGGLLLAVGVFLPWYSLDRDNPNASIDGATGGAERLGRPSDPALAAAGRRDGAVHPGWIVIREHELSWPRGELTAVVGIAAFGLIAYTGLLDRPGSPSGAIGLAARGSGSPSWVAS